MGNVDWQDVAERVAWTFVETGLATLVAAGSAGVQDGKVWKSAAIGGLAAALAFLKNVAFGVTGDTPPDQ